MFDFLKEKQDGEKALSDALDYDVSNKCDKVIKAIVENGKYVCQLDGFAYIRLNSIVFGIRLPSKYFGTFSKCIVTDWESYNVLKPSYGHWTGLWEDETPSDHAAHVLMELISKAQNAYIDAVLTCAQEVQNEPEK